MPRRPNRPSFTVQCATSSSTGAPVKRAMQIVSPTAAFSIYPRMLNVSCGLLHEKKQRRSRNSSNDFGIELGKGIVYKEQVTGQECSATCCCIAMYQCQLADVVAADRLVLKYALDSLGKTSSNRELPYLWTTLCVRNAVCEHNLCHL